jgi:hypothetical protein
VSRHRHVARRQGVVYGPVRPAQPAGAGVVGRLLGGLLVVGAFALLAAGTYAFLGRPPAPPSASPTSVAASPTASPTTSPTTGPTAPPTPTNTLPPSPSPSPFLIEVRQGPGAITFGTKYNPKTLRILDPQTTFPLTGRLVWSAQLTEAAGAPELTVVINAYDPLTGSETLSWEQTRPVENQQATIFLRRLAVERLVSAPGIYVMRYLRGDILLAEGYFEVVE